MSAPTPPGTPIPSPAVSATPKLDKIKDLGKKALAGLSTAKDGVKWAGTGLFRAAGTGLFSAGSGLFSAGSGLFDIAKSQSYKSTSLPSKVWAMAIPILFIVLAVISICFSISYGATHGAYTSEPKSVAELIVIRNKKLENSIFPISLNLSSVTQKLLAAPREPLYSLLTSENLALVNFRPMTVRLAGYLNGINSTNNGVFDMDSGISKAIYLGARSFVFDIDYNPKIPCVPIVVNQDSTGVFRSLNTASLQDGMKALNTYAFSSVNGSITNYDPVIIILYIKRVPAGEKQQAAYFTAIAQAMTPIAQNHLGQTEQGNFNNCLSESSLFSSPITNYQKKFIVLSNHDPLSLPKAKVPTENLDFWTNARIYMDMQVRSTKMGITSVASSTAYVTIGDAEQLLLTSAVEDSATRKSPQLVYAETTMNKYKIALAPLEKLESLIYMIPLTTLMNSMGINSVPLDILNLGSLPCHANLVTGLNTARANQKLTLYQPTDEKDLLSFWALSGWSVKQPPSARTAGFTDYNESAIKEGFVDKPMVKKMPYYVIPTSVVPKRPNPSTNSNGGLVSIA